jgi:hypothetical protein
VFPQGVDASVHFLHTVEFPTTQLDDGRLMDGSCDIGSTVTPTSQTWYQIDLGRDNANSAYAFECPFTCQAEGPDLTILYQ